MILFHLNQDQSRLKRIDSNKFKHFIDNIMHKEAVKMNSKGRVAFLIGILDETNLPKIDPEKINSKLEIQQTLIKRRAVSPKVVRTYTYILLP